MCATAAGRVDVKICGICDPGDARLAGEAGADWMGVILAPGRSRSQTVAQAGVIFGAASLRRTGVFVDAPAGVVAAAARDLELDAVQLHGAEPLELVRQIRDRVACEVWKAVRVREAADAAHSAKVYGSDVDALLLDGWSPDAHGGVGARFDWKAVAAAGARSDLRLIVAGGLTPENVVSAVSLLRPAMVDVSSGVESAPGRKSAEKVHAFVAAVRGVGISQ